MLPDVSSQYAKLSGIDKRNFVGWQIRSLVERQHPQSGATNATGALLVRDLNGAIMDSSRQLIKMMVLKQIIDDMRQNPDQDVSDIKALGRSFGILYRLIISLSKQRKLFILIKKAVRNEKVDAAWNSIIRESLGMFKDRIQYVQNTLIPANMEYTPLWLYLRHLEEVGGDINSDIEKYVTDNLSVPYLGIDSEFVAGYVQHIYSVIASMQDREDIQAEIQTNRERILLARQANAEACKKQAEEDLEKRMESAKDEMLSFASNAESRINRARRFVRTPLSAYAVVVMSVRKTGHSTPVPRYLKGHESAVLTQNAGEASLFSLEEDAEKMGKLFQRKHETADVSVMYHVVPVFRR